MWDLTLVKYFETMVRKESCVGESQRGESMEVACGVMESLVSSGVMSTGFLTLVCFTPRISYVKFLTNATRRGRLT